MKLRDLGSETVLSLTANKARSFLTILGIVVGITAVIVMVAIGNGTKASIEKSIASAGSNLLMVMPNSTGGGDSSLTMEDATEIAELEGVAAVAPVISGSYTVAANGSSTDVQAQGTSVTLPQIRSIETSLGTWFSDGEVTAASKVAVLGPTTSEDLFGEGSNPVGQKIRVGGQPFTVIGVTKSKGSSGMSNQDDVVYVPITAVQRFLSGGEAVSSIYVSATSQEEMETAQNGITDLLNSRHKITDTSNTDFRVMSQQDLADTASTITTTLTLLLGSIAGISLLVGGIGIMNMMLTTVTERIREIGLRKAIGATRGAITSQFLAESVALTVIGGLIGIALGWVISWVVATFSVIEPVVSLNSVLLAVGVSTAIGVIFGYYPARRAAKLDPIDALRYQ